MYIKKGSIILLLLGFYSFLFAQGISEEKIPAAISKAFKTRFSEAKQESWRKEDSDTYCVNFSIYAWSHSATFRNNGKWVETRSEITIDNLPKAVVFAVVKEFKSFVVFNSFKVERSNRQVNYELTVYTERKNYMVEISKKGKIINKKLIISEC